MSQQIEIEFKNLLTKEQYERLLLAFSVETPQIERQINHYFDTPAQHLKKLLSGLRIRMVGQDIECTLKEKTAEHQHLETTEQLNTKQAEQMLTGQSLPATSIRERLQELKVPLHEIQRFGTLTTDRVELPYEGGILVFDHSFYLHCEDYEVEYETNDEVFGKNVFSQFLLKYDITPQDTPKKIARFMTALQQQKG
ncbi:CYTH domain-containing protein [Solibacillus sp. R5-41]|uniref:CYTH domain-containing protein n=1 Tax=Solibacillus sp. R5-41 TaxID=2048654 RepID=UPI000C1284E2|nr:CYTH domain-containing protein [Solibacillus sp. R5-41]ATP39128.1 CYTH domain-containing protein [Solibacillus sp. R5-41]